MKTLLLIWALVWAGIGWLISGADGASIGAISAVVIGLLAWLNPKPFDHTE